MGKISEFTAQDHEVIARVSLDDLTGSELEQAETELFRASIAERPGEKPVRRYR